MIDRPCSSHHARLRERGLRHLPVAEDSQLIGIASSGDLARCVVRDPEHTIDDLTKYISGDIG